MKRFSALKIKMHEQGVTSKEMARELNIAEATFSNKLTGKYPWTLAEVELILDILRVYDPKEMCMVMNLRCQEKHPSIRKLACQRRVV
jgi:predicted transcriptional regulator